MKGLKKHRSVNVVFIYEDLTKATPGLTYEVKQLKRLSELLRHSHLMEKSVPKFQCSSLGLVHKDVKWTISHHLKFTVGCPTGTSPVTLKQNSRLFQMGSSWARWLCKAIRHVDTDRLPNMASVIMICPAPLKHTSRPERCDNSVSHAADDLDNASSTDNQEITLIHLNN